MITRVVAVLLLLAVPLAQQQQPPAKPQDPQRPPTFRTEANFVRVDVYATTSGRPVTDLKLEDFEILEDGRPQKVSTFEYVQVRTGGPQAARLEPNTIQASRDVIANPRARVFVLFLDVPHVTIEGTWHSREGLIRLVDRMLGDDDLVGIMTPMMTPAEVVFARKTDVLARGLRTGAPWGERHTLAEDATDRMLRDCFPRKEQDDIVKELQLRRRERMTLDSLQDLVVWLREQREERKAIVTVSEGWLLYRPNRLLMEPIVLISGAREPGPGPQPVGVGPDGRLRVGPLGNHASTANMQECWVKRQWLAAIDNDRVFKDIIDSANRANSTFYTIDPRGLPVFDYPIGPDAPPRVTVDAQHLQQRTDALRVLADNTDGFAVMGNNNLDPGLRRIADDLSSYYLLGYYSGNTKLDGRFRKITVRITRPGVEVRARRGYKAATEEEAAAARKATAAPPVPESVTKARDALGNLARLRPEAKLLTHAIAVRDGGVTVWFAGELAKPVAAATSAAITIGSGAAGSTTEVPIAGGQRAFMGSVKMVTAPSGPIDVRVRVAPAGDIPFTDGLQIDAVTGLSMPMMFRRGPATGNRYEPAGQAQFSRTERARFDVPKVTGLSLSGVRVLDRNGNPLEVPIAQGDREGWLSAEVTLAALAPGDYLVEMTATVAAGEQKVLSAFRVGR
jgi:VWFA-related protein